MDDSFHIEKGIGVARRLLLDLAQLGLPTATEALDPIMPQYLGDLITWNAIGARTTESQTHREMASGLSTPGGLQERHRRRPDGGHQRPEVRAPARTISSASTRTAGRPSCRRAATPTATSCFAAAAAARTTIPSACALCEQELRKAGLPERIVIDCSHGNSSKDPSLQPLVARDAIEQVVNGNRSIIGLMLESNLEAGNQEIPGRPVEAALRGVGDGWLHRLGHHRPVAPGTWPCC